MRTTFLVTSMLACTLCDDAPTTIETVARTEPAAAAAAVPRQRRGRARPGGDPFEQLVGGLVSNLGGGGGSVSKVIEIDLGSDIQAQGDEEEREAAELASVVRRRRRGGGLLSLLEALSHRNAPPPRRATPRTFVGGVLLPLVMLCTVSFFLARRFLPDATVELVGRVAAWPPVVRAGHLLGAAREAAVRRGWTFTLDEATRVCVSLYFVHEGSVCRSGASTPDEQVVDDSCSRSGRMSGQAAFQVKFEQFHDSLIPVVTPFGLMRMVPPWQKGDAVDLVLLFTALCTMVRRLLPVELGLSLLLVDAATDALDLMGQMAISYLSQGTAVVNELMAKKFSLLGAMVLVTLSRWRAARVRAAQLLPAAHGDDAGAAALLSSAPLLLGRLLIACLFLRVGYYEMHRLIWSPEYVDIDPDDPHNVLWPKLLELGLAVPFVLGLRTKLVSRLLVATLLLEAASVWQFWTVHSLQQRLHAREHCAVNVAVAGGLLLIQEVGGGRYTMDELMKKAA